MSFGPAAVAELGVRPPSVSSPSGVARVTATTFCSNRPYPEDACPELRVTRYPPSVACS